MKRLVSVILLCAVMVMMFGCASAERSVVTVAVDKNGVTTTTTDKIKMNSLGQDFKGSDLAFSQKAGGTTTIKAGAVDNTMSPVTSDVAGKLIPLIEELIKMKTVTPTP